MFFKTHELEATESGGSNLLLGRGTLSNGAPLGFQGDDFAGWGRTYQHRMDIPPITNGALAGMMGLIDQTQGLIDTMISIRNSANRGLVEPALRQLAVARPYWLNRIGAAEPQNLPQAIKIINDTENDIRAGNPTGGNLAEQQVAALAASRKDTAAERFAQANREYRADPEDARRLALAQRCPKLYESALPIDVLEKMCSASEMTSCAAMPSPLNWVCEHPGMAAVALVGLWALVSGAGSGLARRFNTKRDRHTGKFVKKSRKYSSRRGSGKRDKMGRFK